VNQEIKEAWFGQYTLAQLNDNGVPFDVIAQVIEEVF